ncbi:MAG TPA: OmpA family protein [Stellaceae bacterium]|jgi:outer membrane protein OmpA-like peptidoglycan-associated protein|nr:OmpA family protein [Stellaceae bacterium]
MSRSARIRLVVAACLTCAASLLAADSRAQLYIGAEAGWTGLPGRTDTIPGVTSFTARFNAGFNAGFRGGYEWGPWRFEEEYSYRQNGARDLVGTNFTLKGISGDRHTNAIMTNVLYDFTVGSPITPHFGFGVGAVDIFDGLKLPGIGQLFNDSTWQFGYQGIAGLRYNLSPAFTLDLDYRYFATTQTTLNIPRTSLHYSTHYKTQNFVASLIYRFVPPPPPAPVPVAAPVAPPPSPPQVFLVFFDWDRSDITPAGMDIVRQAADAYKAGGSVRLQVTGYTDLSGSPGYNQRLSERRANNVANALANFGVARSDMTVSGRGESDPRVPTPKGVREPQNRRVEIMRS